MVKFVSVKVKVNTKSGHQGQRQGQREMKPGRHVTVTVIPGSTP